MADEEIFGAYRGGRYTRTYMTTIWLLAVTGLTLEMALGGLWIGVAVVVVGGFMGAVAIVGVAQSVLSREGLRLVLLRRWVPWTRVAAVVTPEVGETELRLELDDGTIVTAKGVPPDVGPPLARHLNR